jgi:hypothetical protein
MEMEIDGEKVVIVSIPFSSFSRRDTFFPYSEVDFY